MVILFPLLFQQLKLYHEDFERERHAREAAIKVKNLAEERMKKMERDMKELRDRLNQQAARGQQLQLQLAVRTDSNYSYLLGWVIPRITCGNYWYKDFLYIFLLYHRQLMSYVNKRYDKRMMKSSKRVLSWSKLRY